MLTKKFFIISLSISLLIITAESVGIAMQSVHQHTINLAKLSKDCHDHLGPDGFGSATIGSANIQNQTGQITVPCKIHLKPGSTLQLNSVKLTTKNLLIDGLGDNDKKPKHRPSHIVIDNTVMSGEEAGFQIQLNAPASTVAIQHSQINYPLSVGVSVGAGDKDTVASLEVHDNTMSSLGDQTEGIVLVSTGQATFKNNRFALNDPTNDIALLLGKSCIIEGNTNANNSCQAPQ